MAAAEAKVRCDTPTPGKSSTNIPKWKYDLLRAAIRKVVPKNKAGVEFGQLFQLVAQELTTDDRKKLGSLPWYTTTVKLHLEVIGELERVPDAKPQRLRRIK
jgi:hypothetical protein